MNKIFSHQLMENNILSKDLKEVINFLKKKISYLHNQNLLINLKTNGQNGLVLSIVCLLIQVVLQIFYL